MDDDWDWTVEEMDAIEKDALERLNQERNSSSSSRIPNEVHASSQGTRVLPSTLTPKPNTVYPQKDDSRKEPGQKVSVKILLHSSGDLAAKSPYNQVVVDAVRKIPKAIWNAKERLWTFPHSSLSSAESILREISSVKVEVENLDPLVQRAIASASKVPDLRRKSCTTLEVSSSHVLSSPTKPRNSPLKQQTLHPFLKRCNRSDDDTEHHSRPKVPRN